MFVLLIYFFMQVFTMYKSHGCEFHDHDHDNDHSKLHYYPSSSIHEIDPNRFKNATLYGVGSDLIKNEIGVYGEKLLDSSSAYLQSNVSRYFSNPQYYFQVSDDYVKNKLKVLLLPFLQKGHWMRTREENGGDYKYKYKYKPPIYDINAPDLYIPLMAFGTYLILSGFFLGFHGMFSPEALGVQFSHGLLCWLLQVLLVEATLRSLGAGDIPILDMVAYGGYVFPAACVVVVARIIWSSSFCVVILWESFCMGVLMVKTMKRILVSEVRCLEKHSTTRHYILLLMALAQLPLLFWLGNVGV